MSQTSHIINEFTIQNRLTPQQMDVAWENGWRHFGAYFFRYSATGSDEKPKHITPLRIRLADFQYSKSQKRLWKRNQDLKIQIRDAFIDDEKTALFERHKIRFSEHVPDSIISFLGEEPAHTPCVTKEICLFKDSRLIGASFLDVGHTSTSSIYAMFDPDESKRSLGIYLILLSIHYSRQKEKTWYYPGYAYREASHYDYKKKFAALDYYNWDGKWLPVDESLFSK